MELWERSGTLDLLGDLLRESARGGRVAVVAGEAGIGKSVLVTEFVRRCGLAAWVLWGGCDRLITPRALGPLHDIGRQTRGVLAERLNTAVAQEELFTAFLDEISGPLQRPRPVVVVEDVHWADEATLDWLIWSGRRIGRMPVLFVVTYRDDEVGAEHPLRGALATLPGAITRRVSLSPLSRECVADQAYRAGRDPELVYRLSGGNPLLVTELLKAEGRAVPATVQDLVLDRLRLLPRPARELAHLVSVIPTRADDAIVAGAPDLVDMCVDAGVLVPSGDGVSYRHELLRSAVEDALSPARRVALHRRVLGVLAGVPGVDPGRLVHHATQAGDASAVLRYGQVAGAGAARQGAHREATAHYRSAAGYADRLPASSRPSCSRPTRSRRTWPGWPRRDCRPGGRRWLYGRICGNPNRSVRTCAGSLGWPGGRGTRGRPGRRPRGRSQSSRPSCRVGNWPWPTATGPSCTCLRAIGRRRSPGESKREPWPFGLGMWRPPSTLRST
ncbi:ATP-binding protein [Microtetraspora malaysiensis]|uniref:ATP-binding protein n=1 Tax=Microtetraspora malaysiensis TaxID=161358 RepID=UPI003D93C296